jgi:hypothetical protein
VSDHEAMKLALEALMVATTPIPADRHKVVGAIEALRDRLAEPRPEPFVIKHYTADLRPTIKGNGFDGLEIGESREEAEEFVAWVNARIAAAPAAPPEPVRHPGYVIGNHWLETAYSRVCAGEAEDAILEDYEVVREPRLRDLRRDAERYRWLRGEHSRIDPCIKANAKYRLERQSSTWVNIHDLDAAIDAAMQEDKA